MIKAYISVIDYISYWDTQRKGANSFNHTPRIARFQDAKEDGIEIIRMTCSKWLNGRPDEELGDFLIGSKEEYTGVVEKDLDYLIQVLDDVDKAGMKVVLTLLSLPGSRWSQHNVVNGVQMQQNDLWRDFKYHKQSAGKLWRKLLKGIQQLSVTMYSMSPVPKEELVISSGIGIRWIIVNGIAK